MDGNPDRLRTLAMYAKLPIERITYLPEADDEIIRSIDNGILFLMAFWSGPSLLAFSKLTEIISKLRADALSITVVDVDGSPALYEALEFKGQVRGYGEAAWIRNGKIIATSGTGGDNVKCFEQNTLGLFWGRDDATVSFPEVPPAMEWLHPWQPLSTSGIGFVRELAKELSDRHALIGVPVVAVAKRSDCDDVLFATADTTKPLAVVHLTWSGHAEPDPTWPFTTIYKSWQDWIERCMRSDHEECHDRG
jgi:hypothetical protein